MLRACTEALPLVLESDDSRTPSSKGSGRVNAMTTDGRTRGPGAPRDGIDPHLVEAGEGQR